MSGKRISPFNSISLLVSLLGVVLALPGNLPAALYAYTDEYGVHHFTNVPTDPRYKLVERRTFSPLLSRCITKYDQDIQAISNQYQMDPTLIRSVIRVESGFNPMAVSVKGARGLMQLMPETAQDLRVANPFDPKENIRGGVRYLRYLLDLFDGDLILALAAYNAGENAVLRYQSVPPYPETRAYVQRVLALYDSSLESQLVGTPRKKGNSPGARGPTASPGSARRNTIYKQVRTFNGEEIVVYTNTPVSRHPGID